MPNPRNEVDFDDLEPKRQVTFWGDGVTIVYDINSRGGSAAVGKAVMLSANRTVALTNAGARVLGELRHVGPDGKCTVRTEGFVKLPQGTTLPVVALGGAVVGDTGAGAARGFVRGVAPATLADVAAGRGTAVDISDATAIVVELT